MNFYPAGHIRYDTHSRYVDASGPQSDLSDMTFGKAHAARETKSKREREAPHVALSTDKIR